jgi:UDP-GlcNAc:undecaprenyl-phosphate GlcNAc-1-phosphate transferase
MPSSRKIHERALPRLGGVAVISSFVITLLLTFLWDQNFRSIFSSRITGLFIGILVIAFVGLLDDIYGIRPMVKLAGQVAVSLILFSYDFRIRFFTNPLNGAEMPLPFSVSLFLTICWIVGMINALNLIDGLDGLASGIAAIAGFCLIFVGVYLKTPLTVVILSILCGSSLGFLYYNFPPAKIFLGDTGSMFLGLIVAVSGLVGFQYKVATVVVLIIPICALTLPIYDTALSIWRRMLKERSIFISDKRHLHHRILQFGLTQREVAIAFYSATAYLGIIAFLFVLIPNQYALLLLLLLSIGIFWGMRTIGFIERKLKRIHILEMRLKKGE